MKLNIIKETTSNLSDKPFSKKQEYIETTQNQCDRWWLIEPREKKHPLLTAKGRQRVKRTRQLIENYLNSSSTILDLGCGDGALLHDLPGFKTAVDASSIALKNLQEISISTVRCSLPYLSLKHDDKYDAVLCCDVIGSLPSSLHRLLLSEIAFRMKLKGKAICSTPLDFHSEDALSSFLALLGTEFEIINYQASYHRLYEVIHTFLLAPFKFVRASKDPTYRKKGLSKRQSLAKVWYQINSQSWLRPFWKMISFMFSPLLRYIEKCDKAMDFLEIISKILWYKKGITHLICLCELKKIS